MVGEIDYNYTTDLLDLLHILLRLPNNILQACCEVLIELQNSKTTSFTIKITYVSLFLCQDSRHAPITNFVYGIGVGVGVAHHAG